MTEIPKDLKELGFRKVTREYLEERVAQQPLGEFFVWWDDVSDKDIELFEQCLAKAKTEHDLQLFFKNNPILLIQHLIAGAIAGRTKLIY